MWRIFAISVSSILVFGSFARSQKSQSDQTKGIKSRVLPMKENVVLRKTTNVTNESQQAGTLAYVFYSTFLPSYLDDIGSKYIAKVSSIIKRHLPPTTSNKYAGGFRGGSIEEVDNPRNPQSEYFEVTFHIIYGISGNATRREVMCRFTKVSMNIRKIGDIGATYVLGYDDIRNDWDHQFLYKLNDSDPFRLCLAQNEKWQSYSDKFRAVNEMAQLALNREKTETFRLAGFISFRSILQDTRIQLEQRKALRSMFQNLIASLVASPETPTFLRTEAIRNIKIDISQDFVAGSDNTLLMHYLIETVLSSKNEQTVSEAVTLLTAFIKQQDGPNRGISYFPEIITALELRDQQDQINRSRMRPANNGLINLDLIGMRHMKDDPNSPVRIRTCQLPPLGNSEKERHLIEAAGAH